MRRRVIGSAAIGAVLVLLAWTAWRARGESGVHPVPGENAHVRVEVLNGTNVDGLARRTVRRLRFRGIDVVYFGGALADTFTMTLVLARGADTGLAVRVRDALGLGVVRLAPDPRLLLDVSVILGLDAPAVLDLDP